MARCGTILTTLQDLFFKACWNQKESSRMTFPFVVQDPILDSQLGVGQPESFYSGTTQIQLIDGGVSLDSSQFRSLARSGSFNWAFQSSSAEYWGSQLVSVSSCPKNSGDKISLGFNGSARLADCIDRGIMSSTSDSKWDHWLLTLVQKAQPPQRSDEGETPVS